MVWIMDVFPIKKKTKCLTHNLWNNLSNHILFFLSSISIQDVTENSYEAIFKIDHNLISEQNHRAVIND